MTGAHLDEAAQRLAISGHKELLVSVHNVVALGAPKVVLQFRQQSGGVGGSRSRLAHTALAEDSSVAGWTGLVHVHAQRMCSAQPHSTPTALPTLAWGRCRLISSPSKSALKVEQLA